MTILAQNSITFSQVGGAPSGVIASNPSTMHAVSAVNAGVTTVYLQFFNSSSAPNNGDTPYAGHVYPVYLEGGYTEIDSALLSPEGAPFPAGIAWGFSTTALSYTAAAANTTVLRVRYN